MADGVGPPVHARFVEDQVDEIAEEKPLENDCNLVMGIKIDGREEGGPGVSHGDCGV